MRTLRLGMSGTDVMEIQALLQKTGYNPGSVDGVFGPQTQQSVIQFQQNFVLNPDGIIGPATYKVLNRFLLGYDTYTIKSGDTFYNIAKKYYTNPSLVVTANPSLNPTMLIPGQAITVPYGFDIVDTNISYTYDIMEKDIQGLQVRYPFLEVGIAGTSVLGRKLYYIKIGNGPNQVFYNGVHHSLEWITAPLLMKFIEQFSKAYAQGKPLSQGYNLKSIYDKSSIYIVPMVNPDGTDLVLNGLSPKNPNYKNLIKWNNGSTDFSTVWQANNRGVDLNHNYNAAWEQSKEAEAIQGITGPGPTRYSGTFPESEPESRAMADFTRAHDFRLVIAYHTQGQVIYWNFMDMAPPEGKIIGEQFSKASGYALDKTVGIASYSGYKDWFIKKYQKPGYTVEAGQGVNPLPITQFNEIYNDNLELLLLASII